MRVLGLVEVDSIELAEVLSRIYEHMSHILGELMTDSVRIRAYLVANGHISM